MMITLKNTGMTARISLTGAELKSLRDSDGNEMIWPGNPQNWERSSPLLFPIVSNTRGKKLTIKGKEYDMPNHGVVRNLPWDVHFSQDAPDRAVFSVCENEETLAHYPYRFSLAAAYTLLPKGIRLELTVMNTNDEPMPYCIGTHPGLLVPFESCKGSDFSDYDLIFEKPERQDCPLYNFKDRQIDIDRRETFLSDPQTLHLDHSVFNRVDSVILDDLKSRKVTLKDRKTGEAVEYRLQNFSDLCVWNMMNLGFLCVEAWQGLSVLNTEDNSLEQKHNVVTLAPGESKTHVLEIEKV